VPDLDRLPGRLDGPDGLIELAEKFGAVQVFELIMLCRTTGSIESDAGGQALTTLGNRLVDKVRAEHPELTEREVKQKAAALVGFKDSGSRTNFNKILLGGRRRYRNR
jgi:hypothetical protein